MERTSDRGCDARPVHDTCDICRHPHACYLGGRPIPDPTTGATRWERHVCLGCLMRAGTPGALERCGDCTLPTSVAGAPGARDA